MRSFKIRKHILNFKTPGGTSRGVLKTKPSWIIEFSENDKTGYGEVSLLPGLSFDDHPDFEMILLEKLKNWKNGRDENLSALPSIQFAFEMGRLSMESDDPFVLYPSDFTAGDAGVEINGLVWMGTKSEMQKRIREKLDDGFDCIKLKIGAINFEDELELIKSIRREFGPKDIELRVDANGAFTASEAMEKLKRLAEQNLHSIEQPIKPKQWQEMAQLCENTPLDIALDEELIGVSNPTEMLALVETIKPQALVLKPGLLGGFDISKQWIGLAEKNGAYWWVTSALESNIGLNAIAQFTATFDNPLPQGLGTGQLYTNNIDSPLEIRSKKLYYRTERAWKLPQID
jgi:o-succinylbenzoate synthase